ncbi:sugar phosphate isomerase/epimerase [Paenibacillus terrigena]|uniref:sugar phosphate isomerase/epimerase family protein n=1 Tax=Paenibacillus terrigena TaxID=369333 RepID=UPI0028D217B7|nr:sugar phosphate isomerase/epimerase [Paenibacillus terrigena]
MKLSVFTVATPDLTPEELARAASAAGIQGLEWRCKEQPQDTQLQGPPSFWGNNLSTIDPRATDEQLSVFSSAANRYGLQSIALTPYLTCGDLEGTEAVFKLAVQLGASMVRVGVPFYNGTRNYNEMLQDAVNYLKAVEGLAGDYGIKALVETHHFTIAPSASAAYRLVQGLNPDKVGVLYDPGNMVHEGFETYRMGMELLGPYLAHVHVKNAGWRPVAKDASGVEHPNLLQAEHGGQEAEPLNPIAWSGSWRPIASGMVPWKRVLADLMAVGYDGWLGVEDFSEAYDSKTMLSLYAQQMRTWWEELE